MTQINVTQAAINAGGTGCRNCPLWHAITPLVRQSVIVAVHCTHVAFYNASFTNPSIVTLPDAARDFILSNDRRRFVGDNSVALDSITFELDVPDWVKRETNA